MHEHDWVTGLLAEIERYCISNKLDRLSVAVSHAISVAAEEFDGAEMSKNVVYLSDYFDRRTLSDCESIVLAFAGKIEEML